jgi:hypothetical protein
MISSERGFWNNNELVYARQYLAFTAFFDLSGRLGNHVAKIYLSMNSHATNCIIRAWAAVGTLDQQRSTALLLEHGIETVIHWVHGHSGIPRNEEADRQANAAREGRGSTIREQAFISAANRVRRITEQRAAAKTEWEEKRMSRHCGYRNGKAGSRRPIPMKSKKSLASRYYQLKCGHAPTATYFKRFGQRDDD